MQHSIYPPQALQVSRQTRSEACGIMGRGRLVSITLTVPLSYAHRDFPGAGRTTLKSDVSPVLKKLFALTPNGSRIQQLCLIRWVLLCIQLAPAYWVPLSFKSFSLADSNLRWGPSNTAAKRLRMRQVEHFRSLFQSHFPVKVSRALHSVCSLWFSCSALCCSCFWLFCTYWNCFYG